MTDKKSLHSIVLPDLGLTDVPLTLSVWLVPIGADVTYGDSLVEILAGDATVDLPAPATGTLIEKRVAEDDPVRTGQVLGLVLDAGLQPGKSA